MSFTKTPSSKSPLSEIFIPGFVVASLFVMFFNLPGGVMDWFLSMNITLSLVILLTTFFVRRPLDFNIFPTLLLITTLFRLVLNVATTRLILTRADSLGEKAAGEVIWAFSRFVTGENLIVGIVIFSIFIVIQFVVLTKGATRISEVAARFTLDAIPGRQMAIDADLSAGLIDQKEATRRREELSEGADFFGAMDGAGKFVRGDAVASLLIVFVNIIGGILIGTLQHGMSLTESLTIYSHLTVGDGLVSQVPALLISLATGILVSRGNRSMNLSQEALGQLVFRPVVFAIGGCFLILLMLTGLPRLPLLAIAAGSFLLALTLNRRQEAQRREERVRTETETREKNRADRERDRDRIENYLTVDPIELEIGVGLIGLTDGNRSERMIDKIREIRASIASEIGIILPKVRIRDSLTLDENRYRIKIFGEETATGIVWPHMILAVDSDGTGIRLDGIKTVDPSAGDPAFWIEERYREKAEIFGFRIDGAGGVVAKHLKEVVRKEAAELLTRDAAARLIDGLAATLPKVVDELIPNVLKLGEVQNILQRLLRERVPIRQLGTILEALGDGATKSKNPIYLTERVRARLARTLCGRYRNEERELHVLMLDPSLEEKVAAGSDLSGDEIRLHLSPDDSAEILQWLTGELDRLALFHFSPVLLVGDSVRPAVRALIEGKFPNLPVLCFEEITRDTRVVSEGIVRRMKISA